MFGSTDIAKIKELVLSADIHNNLLAFELIKGHGMVAELKTALYLLYNRFVLENLRKEKKKALRLLQQYIHQHYTTPIQQEVDISILIEDVHYSFKKDLHQQFSRHDALIDWDKPMIAKALPQYLSVRFWGKRLAGFALKYGDVELQKQAVELLKSKDYLGRIQLDLGGIGLEYIPLFIFEHQAIKVLHVCDNQLTSLPDVFEKLPDLDTLNIADNQLKELPESILQLKKLEQLFAQNNLLEADKLIAQLQQLPALKKFYITVSHLPDEQAKKLANFAYLINENKLKVSLQEQQLCLFLFLRDQKARAQLSIKDFLWGACHPLKEIRQQSVKYILEEEGLHNPIKQGSSIALLGKMSQLTNLKFNSIQKRFAKKQIGLSNKVTPKTSHIVLGEYPDDHELVTQGTFSFLTEDEFLGCLEKIKGR